MGIRVNQNEKYMQEALVEAGQALIAGEFPVGCVIVSAGEIVARGHRENSCGQRENELDHAEVITLKKLLHDNPKVNCSSLVVVSTMEPCLMCYATLLLSGVRSFVYGYEDAMGGGTSINLTTLPPLYKDMEVRVDSGVLREECLQLFQQFFRSHGYLKNSFLAEYTLEQKVRSTNKNG